MTDEFDPGTFGKRGARRPFEENESYLHRHAKAVLAGWLREVRPGEDQYLSLEPVLARTNRDDASRGVWLEYPILADGTGVVPLWDESELAPAGVLGTGFVPTVDDLLAAGHVPACVCDIGVAHKGALAYALEIVHRHPTPDWKIAFLQEQQVRLIEFDATKILRQVRRPKSLYPLIRASWA